MTHEDALLAAIEAREAEMVALTQALIRIPSVNPPGEHYRDCAELIGQRLAPRGFALEYLRAEGAPGDSDRYPRWNLIARREGEASGPCVHFNGHIDVVALGEGWTKPPFDGLVEDGRVYGRGACDMKGGLAAAIVAVEALIDSGVPLPGAIEISATGDEESGGLGGVAWLAERGWFSKPRVDHVIIPEPLNVDRVCIGHRGVWWGEIETKGRIAHGSMPFLGDSAIRHMAAVLDAFETRLYPALETQATAMPVEPPGARTPTLNINGLHGGQPDLDPGEAAGLPAPLVADACRLVFDRRLLIEEDLEDVKAEMRALLDGLAQSRPGFRYSLRDLLEVRPSMTEPERPVVRAAAEAVRRVLGREAKLICSPGTYDQKHIDRIGHLRDCVAYGPGILDLAHQPDEYVVIADMTASAKVMALAAHALLTAA
ncbi:MAG TPA: acetylornithine deacetylase/succinyl-diaminopimelate desuccinylase family protein [Caulobacteraceae bacterium]|nr:acetylornithine deacetylase/succinyl-diaminopimelate desuccinylase family protein [Caulobacteraceae bacterium]